jgi:hypothetical protein
MSGVAIICYLLSTNTPVTSVCPKTRILGDVLPLGITLPAISVMKIGRSPRITVAMRDTTKVHTERVQVTVAAKTRPAAQGLLNLVLTACPNTHATVNGIECDSILPEPEGPDFTDVDTEIRFGTRDFIVKWSA